MAEWGGLNPALAQYRRDLNALLPGRSTRSDGGRADSNHSSSSQHQPDADGTVDAFDEDVNYLGSADQDGNAWENRIADALDRDFMADPRWQLIIRDRKIRNPDIRAGAARDYLGDSPHTEHTHRQVRQSLERDARPWRFPRTRAVLAQMEEAKMPTAQEIVKALLDTDLGKPGGDDTVGIALQSSLVNSRTLLKEVAELQTGLAQAREEIAALRTELEEHTTTTPPPAG